MYENIFNRRSEKSHVLHSSKTGKENPVYAQVSKKRKQEEATQRFEMGKSTEYSEQSEKTT